MLSFLFICFNCHYHQSYLLLGFDRSENYFAQETYAASPTEMQVILASPRVQEKLYLEDKCLVPKELSKLCVKEHDILSKPSISNDLNRLVKSEG